MITRLFDIVEEKSRNSPDSVMLAGKQMGKWRTYSCREVWETANLLAGGLLTLGIANNNLVPEQQEKIGIISPNRPEWMITDIAVQLTGAVLTPIYPTISPNEISYLLEDAEIKIIFIASAEIYLRYKSVFDSAPKLRYIFSFDTVDGVTNWRELVGKGAKTDSSVIQKITAETLATIIYTSGTTGRPKGVMLTHNNIVSNVRDSMPVFTFAAAGDKALSFLPLNHVFERMVTYVYLQSGVSVYYAESMDTIVQNLKEVNPSVFTTVPRLLEKVYERIMATGRELTGIKRFLFFWALNLGLAYDNLDKGSLAYQIQLKLANKLIFSKWRAALGGSVKAIVVGSAACQERLVRIFSAAGVVIMEGYGLTETSPVVCVNRFESNNRLAGTVGPLIDNVQVKLAEDGEILIKGPNIMLGYYKQPDLTSTVMKDGWFLSGDIGKWIDGKFLKITDRKKEIFKTSGGKYVTPQVIENKMKECPYIEQIMIVGENRKFVSALVVPNIANLNKYLSEIKYENYNNLACEDIIRLPVVLNLFQEELDKFNPFFNHTEQIKKIALLPQEWTIDNGELTPSMKMKRKIIENKYAGEIEKMYAEHDSK